MNRSLQSCILSDDLVDFERKTFRKELKNVLDIYPIDLVSSKELRCLQYISRFVSLKDFRDAHGRTLLHYVVLLEDKDAMEKAWNYLTNKGCSPNIPDRDGRLPMDVALLSKK